MIVFSRSPSAGYSRTDLLASIAVLSLIVALSASMMASSRAEARMNLCQDNLRNVARAVLLYTQDGGEKLPGLFHSEKGDSWWFYKEYVKGYLGLTGPSSANDRVFACPSDRGYSEPQPFHATARFDYSSYVFNGVTLGTPNIAGWELASVRQPDHTLLVMEWAAHAPLSWHRSRTGRANGPFYNNAESVVAFADGRAGLIKIYYDGYNAAYTRDPIAGYAYKYSGN